MATTPSAWTNPTVLPPIEASQSKRRLRKAALAVGMLVLLVWSWRGTGMSLSTIWEARGRVADFLERMYPPDLRWNDTQARAFETPLKLAVKGVAVTLQVSLLGTALGSVVALGLGFLAAENLTPHWVHHPLKIALALLRSVPVVLLGLIFVAALGLELAESAGVLAIAIHSIGMLGKLFADECETADMGVWEALDSAGANWLQKVRYAIWSQVAPQMTSLTLFRLDMNIRDSAVLGLIGVASLGMAIERYRHAFDYRSVATLVIVTMLLVLVVDQTSVYLRRRLK